MDSLKLEELEREITCAICKDHYTLPKILPCLHYYCKQCIFKLVLRTRTDKQFSCPECGKEAILPSGSVDQLQTALFVNRLKAAFSTLKRTCGKVKVTCDACTDSGPKAEAFCQECAVFICGKCVESHQILKMFASHEVVSFQELKERKAKDIVIKEPPAEKCPVHKELLIIYCYDCGCLICCDCTTFDHQDHNLEICEVAAPKPKEMRMEELNPLREVKISLLNVAGTTPNELEAQEDSKKKPLEEVEMKVTEKTAKLSQHVENLSSTCGEFQTVLDYNQMTEAHHIEICLVTKLSDKTTRSSPKLECQLKSLYNESIINCEVERIRDGEYHIQFTPTVRGRHELIVSVDGQKVAGSPFPVFISIHPTQLGQPVRVWEDDISMPAGVTVNSVGEIIVAGWDGDVVMFDKEGKKLKFIKCLNFEFCRLADVSVDSEDNIYLAADCKDAVFKLNKNGGTILKKHVQQVDGPGHFSVAVVGEEVMVCECNNRSSYMVYDRHLKFAKQIIGRRSMGEFFGVSPDCHGNLYVADPVNSCIRIFSCDGDFLRSFGCDGNNMEKSSRPYYVCVAGQYVYVTDHGNDNVSVFTVDGKYVTSFGHYGSKEGDFNYPHGVCVDKDGFVYVCDLFNNRLQIF